MALARPDRLKTLASSGLVRTWEPGETGDGLHVTDGEIHCTNPKGWTTPFPGHLLSVDGDVGTDAKEILLSQNRLVLSGDLLKSLAFLQSFGDAVKHIRALDIRFSATQIEKWSTQSNSYSSAWTQLASFIASALNFAELDFALDAGPGFATYRQSYMCEESLPEVRDTYEEIIWVLVEALAGRKPRAFAVYWAAFHDHEVLAEEAVMGEEYDSWKCVRKVPREKRNPFFPHGAPNKELEWARGMRLY